MQILLGGGHDQLTQSIVFASGSADIWFDSITTCDFSGLEVRPETFLPPICDGSLCFQISVFQASAEVFQLKKYANNTCHSDLPHFHLFFSYGA